MKRIVKKYWFLFGLFAVFAATLLDTSDTVAMAGKYLKAKKGPDAVVVMIFFFSGLLLDAEHIKSGVKDIKGYFLSIFNIFIMAPLIAFLISFLSLPAGLIIGIFIVSAMPSTLSSGVVMTGSSGGNMAHALFITISANILSVFTIPLTLSILVSSFDGSTTGLIDKQAMMMKIAFLVILPLIVGLLARTILPKIDMSIEKFFQIFNQSLILGIVWMSVSTTKETILLNLSVVPGIFLLVAGFHMLLLFSVLTMTHIFRIEKGRRESVIFMGGQKTLPLSIIVQVTLFPQYGIALVVCVLHHIVHLVIDGYLVGRFSEDSLS